MGGRRGPGHLGGRHGVDKGEMTRDLDASWRAATCGKKCRLELGVEWEHTLTFLHTFPAFSYGQRLVDGGLGVAGGGGKAGQQYDLEIELLDRAGKISFRLVACPSKSRSHRNVGDMAASAGVRQGPKSIGCTGVVVCRRVR